jgi:hypothetical protein
MAHVNRGALGALVLLALGVGTGEAGAETKLTDFNGTWQGSGTDRSTPLESTQQTHCRASINADIVRMGAHILCNGEAGLTKVIQLNITLAGDAFTGTLSQKATTSGSDTLGSNLNGSVAGHKTDKTADFAVSFPGLTPSVAVVLALINSASFSMRATTLGGQLMNVTFKRFSPQ